MNKQEVIKKAYVDLIGIEEYEKYKHCIDEDGVINIYGTDFSEKTKGFMFYNNDYYLMQPTSLKGIENNNGWLSVKHHGLPNKDGFYWCINKKKTETIRYYFANEKEFDEGEMEILNQKSITHYQPIEKKAPPLY